MAVNSLRSLLRRIFGPKDFAWPVGQPENYGSESSLVQEGSTIGTRNVSVDYTELMGGSVPCPSCKGSGRIPKELEETLVALIPVNDERLKPKRTCLYVLLVMVICIIFAGVAIFLMVPRAVDLTSNRLPIAIVDVVEKSLEPSRIKFNFLNSLNISNSNYYSVRVTNCTAKVYSKFQPWSSEMIGFGGNATTITVDARDTKTIFFNNTITLEGFTAQYCEAPFSELTSLYVHMEFEVSVTLEYLSHREHDALTVKQEVCCIPSGNCTM